MKFFLIAVLISALPFTTFSQNETQAFGKVDQADLELKECPFEKDAHAMVLFDVADIYFDDTFSIVAEYHKRIKIFDGKAKDEGNIRLEFYSANQMEDIFSISAQTINFKNGKQVVTKLDKKQIFTEKVDKYVSAMVFSLPDVQAGSIIEYKYKLKTWAIFNFPRWNFQHQIPCRYSELKTSIPDLLVYKPQFRVHDPFSKRKSTSSSKFINMGDANTSYNIHDNLYGLSNIPSLQNEPFMTSIKDNVKSVVHQLTTIKPLFGFVKSYNDTWKKVGETLMEDEDFGLQFKKKIKDEETILANAKKLPTEEGKIAFIFNEVKNSMKWDGFDRWYTIDGISKAWEKKTGNSTELNLIVYRLLKQAGLDAYPMVVSTRTHGKPNPIFPSLYQFNRTVVYIPVDSTRKYVLDATNKYNLYNVIPETYLNSYGLLVDKENKKSEIKFITEPNHAIKSVFVNATIDPSGKMAGNVDVLDYSYHKVINSEYFKKEGQDKYQLKLTENNNTIKLKNLKISNENIDSLPLTGNSAFEIELTGSDGNYIYFNPNLFSSFSKNPFLNEKRATNIDFGYNNKYIIGGTYKIPAGYTVQALPKSQRFVMPDKSISFQRLAQEADGIITVRFIIQYQKSVFTTEDYPNLREFYKQMYELLNEQIVLKKS